MLEKDPFHITGPAQPHQVRLKVCVVYFLLPGHAPDLNRDGEEVEVGALEDRSVFHVNSGFILGLWLSLLHDTLTYMKY